MLIALTYVALKDPFAFGTWYALCSARLLICGNALLNVEQPVGKPIFLSRVKRMVNGNRHEIGLPA